MTQISKQIGRLVELDAMRGIAVIMVVLFHYTVRYHTLYTHTVTPLFTLPNGSFGVLLFFIISGFVIFLTLDRTKHTSDFLVSRVSRLYPPYWAAIAITYTSILIFDLPDRNVTFTEALINLTMLQKWLGASHVDKVYWTLSVELCFYLGMGVLFATKQFDNIVRVGLVWLFILFAGAIAHYFFQFSVHWPWRLLLMLEYGNLFLAGMMFYKLRAGFAWRFAFFLPAALILEYLWRGDSVYYVLSYFAGFWLFLSGHLAWLVHTPLVFLGKISYSLYLIHQNIGYIVQRELYAQNLATPWSVILAPLAVSLTLAWLMHRYVEQPALRAIRTRWTQRSKQHPLAEQTA